MKTKPKPKKRVKKISKAKDKIVDDIIELRGEHIESISICIPIKIKISGVEYASFLKGVIDGCDAMVY